MDKALTILIALLMGVAVLGLGVKLYGMAHGEPANPTLAQCELAAQECSRCAQACTPCEGGR